MTIEKRDFSSMGKSWDNHFTIIFATNQINSNETEFRVDPDVTQQ